MSDAEEGTPIVHETEYGIVVNVPKADVRVPVEFNPEVRIEYRVSDRRRDIILAIIAAALVAGLFF